MHTRCSGVDVHAETGHEGRWLDSATVSIAELSFQRVSMENRRFLTLFLF